MIKDELYLVPISIADSTASIEGFEPSNATKILENIWLFV
jgi:hypothetical protein